MASKAFQTAVVCLALLGTSASSDGKADILSKIETLEHDISELRAQNAQIQGEIDQERGRRLSTPAWEAKVTADIATNAEAIATATTDLGGALDHLWLLLCGALVMLMQAGFAMVEAGSCRVKNVQNILMKNIVDVCLGTICWYSFGWTIAYGFDGDDKDAVFAGKLQYFGHEFLEADDKGNQTPTNLPRDWFFQWAFCSAAATIVSGGVAERVQFPGYLIYTILMTTVIYPVVVAWMWSGSGWLAPGDDKHINDVGFNDFAGSGIVHMTGGVGALVGAIVVGPRKGRFDSEESFDPHSLPLIVLGTFILWFGWYGFNCGSTLGMSSTSTGQLAAVVAMNTTLSAATAGLVVLGLRLAILKRYDIGGMCNGILAGLVSITAGCGNMDSGAALVTGLIGGFVYQGASMLLRKLKIDDPVDAFPVHGAAGAWGVLAAALFDWGKGMDYYNGFGGGLGCTTDADGNCMSGAWAKGFAANVVEVIVILVWVGGLSAIIFVPLKLAGLLRANDDIQEKGMDEAKHSPSKAYY